MTNLAIYHSNRLKDAAAVSGTALDPFSSHQYLYDDRLSFAYAASGTEGLILVDAVNDLSDVSHLVLIDHTMNGGEAVVESFEDMNRTTSAGVAFSGTLGFSNPSLTALSIPSTGSYVDVSLTTSGGVQLQVGELMLAEEFVSPQRPQLGSISTTYTPQRTTLEVPNGELQSIKHGGVRRNKTYVIPGLTTAQASEWTTLYSDAQGVELVVVSDEDGDTYPVYLNRQLPTSRIGARIDINLELTEIKLT